MEYTIRKLSRLAGVSTRTLRYYDEIGLLKPARINTSGYRIYGPEQVDHLQLILFYRALEFKLDEIRTLLSNPDFDRRRALNDHHAALLDKRRQLNRLIATVEKTIATEEGRNPMSDNEKFAGLKRTLVEENEQLYGDEIRGKYGNEAVDKVNARVMNRTRVEHRQVEELTQAVLDSLSRAFETGDPGSAPAQEAADLHRQWLSCYWERYSPQGHANIVDMYLADGRFAAYYDAVKPGLTAFLRDAVHIYLGKGTSRKSA